MSSRDIQKLLEGTKVHRRIMKRKVIDYIEETTDSDSDDSDYVPENEAGSTDSESASDNDDITEPNLSTITTTSTGDSCIRTILRKLQQVNNKHKWNCETVDTFIQTYLSNKKGISKLFAYELDIINNEIMEVFGKQIFQKSDKKHQRVNKLFIQFRNMPQLLKISSSDDDNIETSDCSSLVDICRKITDITALSQRIFGCTTL